MAPLLGVLFAILVALLAIRPYLAYQQQAFDNVKAANTASQFRQIINAAKTYVQNTYPPSQSASATTTLSGIGFISALQNDGLLPSGIQPNNPYGQTWNMTVSQQGNTVQAFVYSSGGMPIPPQQAPEIAAETGADAGFMPTSGQYSIYNVVANTAVGAYGHWNALLPPGLSPTPAPGDLVAQLDVQNAIQQDNDYLYRLPVQGDPTANTMGTILNMGGNSIINATSVNTKDGSGNSASMGADLNGSNQENLNVVGNAQTIVNLGSGTPTSASSGVTSVDIGSYSKGNTNLDVGKTSSGNASLTVGSGASGNSSIAVGGNGASGNSSLTVGGLSGNSTITIGGNNSSGNSSLLIGGTNASGNSSLTIEGSGASEELSLTSIPETAGSSCSGTQLGTIAPTASGIPVVCAGSSSPLWTPMGGAGGSVTVTVSSSTTINGSTTTSSSSSTILPNSP